MTKKIDCDKLLSRDEFREQILARKSGKCCVPNCGEKAVDAHHIIERKLWDDGGYYINNGAQLCSKHHLDAEQTKFSTSQLRIWCSISKILLPPNFDRNLSYDKWGNIVLDNNQRLPGPLFTSEGCQKSLAAGGMMVLFENSKTRNERE